MKKLGLIGILMVSATASAAAQQAPTGKGEVQKDEIPTAYKPPKGMCRIWLKDVPPARQPAPTDCASAVKNNPPNGRVIFGETEEKKEKPKGEASVKSYTGKGAPPVIIKKPPTR